MCEQLLHFARDSALISLLTLSRKDPQLLTGAAYGRYWKGHKLCCSHGELVRDTSGWPARSSRSGGPPYKGLSDA